MEKNKKKKKSQTKINIENITLTQNLNKYSNRYNK